MQQLFSDNQIESKGLALLGEELSKMLNLTILNLNLRLKIKII
jgi:hypothetical protein